MTDTNENELGYSLGDEELVPEETPYGTYYVTRAKRERSQQIRAALEALKETL